MKARILLYIDGDKEAIEKLYESITYTYNSFNLRLNPSPKEFTYYVPTKKYGNYKQVKLVVSKIELREDSDNDTIPR